MSSLPTARDVHVDALLTNYAIAYGQDMKKDFVADQASTVVKVQKQSDKYAVYSKADFFRSEMDLRADGDAAKVAGFRVDLSNGYFAETYALKTFLSDRQRKNSDVDLEKAKVRYLMGQAKLKRDLKWAELAFVTGVWTGVTEQTGVASGATTNQFLQFNDASSDPIGVITRQMLAVQASTGKMPNTMISNLKVANDLKQHGDFVDRIKYTQTGIVDTDLIAQVLGLKTYAVAGSIKNTAAENVAASMSRVHGNHIVLAYIAPQASDDEPTALSLFSWSEFDGVTPDGAAIRSWYDEDRKGTWYEAEQSFAVKITATDLGVMLLDACAA